MVGDLPARIRRRRTGIADNAGRVLKLMESLEDQDDVQNVWANFDIDPEILAAVAE